MGNYTSGPKRLELTIVSDKKEAQTWLDAADLIDYYIEDCQDDRLNALARKNLNYRANAVALQDLTHAKSFIEGVYAFLPQRLLIDLGEVKIIQLMPTADGGMPHTRPDNIICYPDFAQLFSRTTLVHELWHIHQRIFVEQWRLAFKRMGWTMWNGTLPKQLDEGRRYNPDTIDSPFWIFNDTWVPVPVFKDITHPKVGEVEIWFYNPVKDYHSRQIPPELLNYCPHLPSAAYEHPRELAAYILSESDKYQTSMAFKHLIESLGNTALKNLNNN